MRLADVLLAYSEWLDSEHLMRAEPLDGRTHEDLIVLFRASINAGSPLASVFKADPDLDEETDKVEGPGERWDQMIARQAAEEVREIKDYKFPTTDGESDEDLPDNVVRATYQELLKIVQGKVVHKGYGDEVGTSPDFSERIRAAEAILGERNVDLNVNINRDDIRDIRTTLGDS